MSPTGSFPPFTLAFIFTLPLLFPESTGKNNFPSYVPRPSLSRFVWDSVSPVSSMFLLGSMGSIPKPGSVICKGGWGVGLGQGSAHCFSFLALNDVSYPDTKAFEREIMEFGIFVL